jgi:predicted small lipoprotein YifL
VAVIVVIEALNRMKDMHKRLNSSVASARWPLLLCGVAFVVAGLSGCGQKGPLKLPAPAPAASATSAPAR